MSPVVDMNLVKRFLEEDWVEGWGLSYYRNLDGYSKLGLMVYNTKYNFHGRSIEERELTAEHLRAVVKDFIAQKYPLHTRPFDTVITPPGNLEKPFDLTKFIAARLTSGGIRDISSFVAKTRPIPVMKNLPARERRAAIKDAFELIGLPEEWRPKGFLILDDILDTGATAGEMCNLLEEKFPGVPRYYLAITYWAMGSDMRVVLGGSRHLEFIPPEVSQKLNDLISIGSEFLVGDAPGSDRAFQKYLLLNRYSEVRIYSSAEEIRNNLGNWPSEKIDSGLKSKSSAMHAFKDRHMTKIADLGIMVWDGESAGTLSNVLDLLNTGKECYIYLGVEQEFFKVDNKNSLMKLLSKYPEALDEANKRLETFRNREAKRTTPKDQLQTLF